MKKTFLVFAVLLAIPAFAHPGHSASAVRASVIRFNTAYADNDHETYFSYYKEDAVLFFFGERHKVSDYYESWKETIEAGFKYEKYDLSDVRIQVLSEGTIAVATYFVDLSSPTPEGTVADARAFESTVWEKVDDEWKIVTLHYTDI